MNRIIQIIFSGALLFSAAAALAEAPADAVPDAPAAQEPPAPTQTNTNSQTPASAPSIIANPPAAPLGRLSLGGKFSYYVKSEFGPAPLLTPAVTALYRIANPIDTCSATKTVACRYPPEWEDGGGGFGRNYGAGLASAFSDRTAAFVTGAILREDPRYFPSQSTAFGARVIHAIFFTVVDKGDSGKNRPAISNFAGAAAAGFIGNAYLPPGFRDAPHAEQRSLIALAFIAAGNGAAEFRPEIRSGLRALHVPFIK